MYPLIAPPTPERLEQDKKSIEEQFDKAFGLVEQLARDTEALKAAEQDRTERLDAALSELESTIRDLKSANQGREDDSRRIRSELERLRESVPRAMEAQKDMTDSRLKEVNSELVSLRTLVSRVTSTATSASAPGTGSSYLRPTSGNATTPRPGSARSGDSGSENAEKDAVGASGELSRGTGTTHSSPFSGRGSTSKASIPAWQMPVASKNTGAVGGADTDENGDNSVPQNAADS